jgi:hypothetical protein
MASLTLSVNSTTDTGIASGSASGSASASGAVSGSFHRRSTSWSSTGRSEKSTALADLAASASGWEVHSSYYNAAACTPLLLVCCSMKVYTLKHTQGRDFDTKTIPHPLSSGYYSPRHRRRCVNACEWCLQVLLQSASKPGSIDGDGNHVDSPAHSKRGPMETGVSTTQSTAKPKACPVTYSHTCVYDYI